MALIKCPECGQEISDSCKTCVHCGYKFHKPMRINWKGIMYCGFGTLLVSLIMFLFSVVISPEHSDFLHIIAFSFLYVGFCITVISLTKLNKTKFRIFLSIGLLVMVVCFGFIGKFMVESECRNCLKETDRLYVTGSKQDKDYFVQYYQFTDSNHVLIGIHHPTDSWYKYEPPTEYIYEIETHIWCFDDFEGHAKLRFYCIDEDGNKGNRHGGYSWDDFLYHSNQVYNN